MADKGYLEQFTRREKELETLFARPADPDTIPIVNPKALRTALEDASMRSSEPIERFLKSTCYRKLVKVNQATLRKVEDLRTDFPNFSEAIDFYLRCVSLNLRGKMQYLSAPPILLNGPPGIGKTRFADHLAKALSTEYHEICCSTVTASFILSGTSNAWSESKPGKVFEYMRIGKTANPVMLIDEVDKLRGDYRYDGFGPLYGLLEKNTAKRFIDENFGMPMDCSHILWIGTSNELTPIPEPILSRLRTIEIDPPNRAQMRQVVRSIYRAILEENHDWSRSFSDRLADEVIDRVDTLAPRTVKQFLIDAFGNAALRSKGRPDCALTTGDLFDAGPAQRPRIGFIQ